jgi:hypothetical protein
LRVQATNSPGSFEVTTDGTGVVGPAGAALLRELADRLGLTGALGWRQADGRRRRHPDAAVLRDLAVVLADGGDCLSDLAVLRDQPELFGPVASTPPPGGLSSAPPRTPTGWLGCAPPGRTPVPVPGPRAVTRRRGAGGGCGRDLGAGPYRCQGRRGGHLQGVVRVRAAAGLPGPWAGASDELVELVDLALAQLPASDLPVLVRSDSAGGSTRLAWHLRERGVGFTLGMQVDAHVREAILVQPEHAWTPAVEPDGQVRDGAEGGELTGWVDLRNWPDGTRVLCRREDAHPGAQLRFTDHDGHRFQVL